MKAFQLKIIIKNSKPPIWRRMIVPSGITFSQLSMIINEAMGWCGYHAFEFEFYHRKIRLIEDAADFDSWYGEFDYLEASETFIREYMEENDWFTYTYDLGDDWQHRVTIEKVIENYEYDYPQVIKYKGNCPVEDCGGIYGYYECLDIIADKNHPEYEERLEWMESQGYPDEYDMEYVNQILREHLFSLGQETLNDIFDDFEKTDIKEIAKEKGLTGLSNLNKERLIDKLVKHMLRPEIIKKYFLCLTDDEIAEFEKACKEEFYLPEEAGLLLPLYETAYIGMLPDGQMMVPRQVQDVYETIKGPEFENERKRMSYILCCLRAAERLYGIVPMEVFEKLVAANISEPVTAEELKQMISDIPPEWNTYVVTGDKIYGEDFFPDDGGLLEVQRDKEYYIPTLKEIMDYGTKGYDADNRYAKKLEQFILRRTDAMPDEAEFAAHVIQMDLSENCELQQVFDLFEDLGIELKNEKDLNGLVSCIMDLWNDTRRMVNRGFTANELTGKRRNPDLTWNQSNVINFPVERRLKIYPNDPCPCGSGKKYKNCCKNKNEQ